MREQAAYEGYVVFIASAMNWLPTHRLHTTNLLAKLLKAEMVEDTFSGPVLVWSSPEGCCRCEVEHGVIPLTGDAETSQNQRERAAAGPGLR